MKAAVLRNTGESFRIEELNQPICGREDILVRVMSCGICGSDARIAQYGNPRVTFPAVMGHEISGVIAEKGGEVKRFSVGDRIAMGADIPCGQCGYCQSGFPNNCATNLAIGYQYAGGFAEFIRVDRRVWDGGPFHTINENISFEEASLAEPMACAINGLEILPNRSRDSIVILGAGVLGCMFTQLARVFGYKKVFLVDVARKKLSMAENLGFEADGYLVFNKSVTKKIRHLTAGRGADAVIVACSDQNAQSAALAMTAKRGAINLFAGTPLTHPNLSFSSNTIHYNEIFLTGSHGSTPRQHSEAVRLLSAGKVNLRRLISHSFSLDNINEAFATFSSSDRLKIIVRPHKDT